VPPPETVVPEIVRLVSPDYAETGQTLRFVERPVVGVSAPG